jgi:hypothetical protein
MAKKSSKNWIADMHMKEGAFTAQAKKAGKSVPAFEAQVLKPGSKASATTKRRANLAKTLRGLNKKGKK